VKKLNVWDHPEFERVTAAFRKAMRERGDAAIDRTRREIDRLKGEINGLERLRVTEELALNPPKRRIRRDRTKTDRREGWNTLTRALLLGGGAQ
jgi:hypothetical protein